MSNTKAEKVWVCNISIKQAEGILCSTPKLRITGETAKEVRIGDHVKCSATYPNGTEHKINDMTFIVRRVVTEDSLMKVIELSKAEGIEVVLTESYC